MIYVTGFVVVAFFGVLVLMLLDGADVETVEDGEDFQTAHEALRLASDVDEDSNFSTVSNSPANLSNEHLNDALVYLIERFRSEGKVFMVNDWWDAYRDELENFGKVTMSTKPHEDIIGQSWLRWHPTPDDEGMKGLPPLFLAWWKEQAAKLDEGND